MDVPKNWLDRAVELDRQEGRALWDWGDHVLALMPMQAVGRPADQENDATPIMEQLKEVSDELEALGVEKAPGTLESYRSTAAAWETHTREGITYSVAKALRTQADRYDLVFERDWTKSQAEEFATIRSSLDPKVTVQKYDEFRDAREVDPTLTAKKYFSINRELALAYHEVVLASTKLEKSLADAGSPSGNEDTTREVAQEALSELEKLRKTAQRRLHAIEVVEA